MKISLGLLIEHGLCSQEIERWQDMGLLTETMIAGYHKYVQTKASPSKWPEPEYHRWRSTVGRLTRSTCKGCGSEMYGFEFEGHTCSNNPAEIGVVT